MIAMPYYGAAPALSSPFFSVLQIYVVIKDFFTSHALNVQCFSVGVGVMVSDAWAGVSPLRESVLILGNFNLSLLALHFASAQKT